MYMFAIGVKLHEADCTQAHKNSHICHKYLLLCSVLIVLGRAVSIFVRSLKMVATDIV